jgi:multidrug efflux pump subunit AcrA (membrane-fusion protein)
MIKHHTPILLFLFICFSCKNKQEKNTPLEEKITESVYASGIVKSKNQYQVFSTVNGLIANMLVTEGDIVTKGQPIINLVNTAAQLNEDNAIISANYLSAQTNVERLNELKINIDVAKTKMENDALILQRQTNLWNEQIGTKNDLDLKELAAKTSANAYQAAKLKYIQLQKQISFQEKQATNQLQISQNTSNDFTIKSDVSGKVYTLLKKKGELVTTQTPVALIGDATAYFLELQVDEYDIAKMKLGQQILLNMDSYKGQVFEATVSKIYPYMNERSKSFTIEAMFTKQPPSLYPNLTCEANIIIQQKEKAITIPRNYLLAGDSVILENKEKKKVVVGLKDYQKVEIVSGLTVKDIILKPL